MSEKKKENQKGRGRPKKTVETQEAPTISTGKDETYQEAYKGDLFDRKNLTKRERNELGLEVETPFSFNSLKIKIKETGIDSLTGEELEFYREKEREYKNRSNKRAKLKQEIDRENQSPEVLANVFKDANQEAIDISKDDVLSNGIEYNDEVLLEIFSSDSNLEEVIDSTLEKIRSYHEERNKQKTDSKDPYYDKDIFGFPEQTTPKLETAAEVSTVDAMIARVRSEESQKRKLAFEEFKRKKSEEDMNKTERYLKKRRRRTGR